MFQVMSLNLLNNRKCLSFSRLKCIKYLWAPLEVRFYSYSVYKYSSTIQRFLKKDEAGHAIWNCDQYQMIKKNALHSSSTVQNEIEVQRILSMPENKLNQLNIINSSSILHTIKELQNWKDIVTEADMQRLSHLTYKAVEREFRPNSKLVEAFWAFATSIKGFSFTNKHLSLFLSLCKISPHKVVFEDVMNFMKDHNIKLNQEICELLLANLCQHGNKEESETLLELMKAQNLCLTEEIFGSLLLLKGKHKDLNGVRSVLHTMNTTLLKPSSLSKSKLVVAYNLCGEVEEAKAIMEALKKSQNKFTSDQYCEILLSFVLEGNSKQNMEHLNYILKSKLSICENISLRKVILQLISSSFPSEAIFILSTQGYYLKRPHLNSNALIFIKELVRSKHDTSLVTELCTEIVRKKINTNGLQMALDVSLSEHCVELAWKLLRALKKEGAPLRQHYFWPLLAHKHPNDDHTAKTLRILDGMTELGVKATSETLTEFVFPNLSVDDPCLALQMLSRSGISKSQALTPLLAHLISEHLWEECREAVTSHQDIPFSLDDLLHTLASSYLKERESEREGESQSESALKTLYFLVSKRGEREVERGRGREGNDAERKRNREDSARDIGEKFVDCFRQVWLSTGERREREVEREVGRVVQGLHTHGIPMINSKRRREEGHIEERKEEEEEELISSEESDGESPLHRGGGGERGGYPTLHPSEMTVEELFCHLVELKSKDMNTRGVLRKLLIRCSQDKDQDKIRRVVQELESLEAVEGQTKLGAGALSSQLQGHLLDKNAEAALEAFLVLVFEFPTFRIDSYKVVDLCCLLARANMAKESLEVLRDYTATSPRDFHRPQSMTRNCHNLLCACAECHGHAFAHEVCQLLIEGGMALPSPVLFGPLIKARLNSNDLPEAVLEAEQMYSSHKVLPMRLEILIRLLKSLYTQGQEDKDSDLEGLVDRMVSLISRSRGARQAKQDILYATIETGEAVEAEKVFKHVEGHLDKQRIRDLCTFLVKNDKTECLALLLNISKGSKIVDRLFICNSLLNIYYINRNGEAALSLLTQMQEDGLRPSPGFMNKLSALLKATAAPRPQSLS